MRGRRRVLRGLAALALLTALPARATPAEVAAAIRARFGAAPVRPGRVRVEMPPIAENGNGVALRVRVESPMTPGDYVESIHVFQEKNPLPVAVEFFLGPRAGRAEVSTRIRVGGSQQVLAVAKMSDGSLWSGTADIIVTLAACGEADSP